MTMQRNYFLRITTVFALLLYSLSGLAASQYWATANPLSDSSNATSSGNLTLYNAYHTGATTIAVGERGAILTTTDGSNWVAHQSGMAMDLNDIVYDGSQYIALGWGGVTVTSQDNMMSWQTSNTGVSYRLRGIAYNGTNYVIVGDNGALLSSTDGITWTRRNSGTGAALLDVFWDSRRGVFYAVGGGTDNNNNKFGIILDSSDGLSWSAVTAPGAILHGIASDGVGGNVIIVGDNGTVVVRAGNQWVNHQAGTAADLYAVTYESTLGNFVAVGTGGTILYTSDATTTWTPSTSGTTNNLYSIIWDGSRFIVTGSNTLLSSTDPSLSIWDFGSGPIPDSQQLTGVATDASGTNLAVTATGDVFSDGTAIPPKNDGLDWSLLASTGYAFTTLIWDGTRYVAIDNGSDILTSADGTSWTTKQTGVGTGLNGIAYNSSGSVYVVVGDNTIQTSPDLTTWTTVAIPTNPTGYQTSVLTGVTWNPVAKEFLVVTNNGVVLHGNASGQTWTAKAATQFKIQPQLVALNAVSWNGSQYVAVGLTGSVLYSNDGNDWQFPGPADTFRDFNAITWSVALGRFIAVGNNGVIMVSAGADIGVKVFNQDPTLDMATEAYPFGYMFEVRNNGSFDAKNVVLTLTLPSDTTIFDQFDPSCFLSGLSLVCDLGDMVGGGGDFASVNIAVTVQQDSPLVHGNLAVTATVKADGHEALPNDNHLVTATYVQSLYDKIAVDYNNSLGGTGRLAPLSLGLLFLTLLTVFRQRRRRSGHGG